MTLSSELQLDVLENVRSMENIVRRYRDQAETEGRLSDQVVQALLQAGVGRLYLPKSLGGLEVDPCTCAAVTQALARVDSSAAWFVMVANAAKLNAGHWPMELAEKIFSEDPDVIVAASGNRPYSAVPEEGGYRLSGVNSFVSGCHHAQWLMSPVLAGDAFMMALIPMTECKILDNWHALGMRGTGSNDVELDSVWIPENQVVNLQDPAGHLNRHYSGDLYRCPSRILFATYVPVTLVLAEQALAELADLAQLKTPYAEDRKLKHRSLAQVKYGKALATHRASRRLFDDAIEEAWSRARAGETATPEQKADLYLAGTHAVQASAQVVRWVADAAGTSVIYQGRPLERIVRDMETLRHHGFASESRYGSVAQLYWDAELDYPLMLR